VAVTNARTRRLGSLGVAVWGGGADAGGGAGAGDVDIVVGRKKCGTGVEGAQTGAIGVGRDGWSTARGHRTATERARGVDAAARRDGTGVAAQTRAGAQRRQRWWQREPRTVGGEGAVSKLEGRQRWWA
jgi:hypothetical protein